MKVAIMQPYFMPYIGYFQLINAVDTFVIYDSIEYTKRGWINRNRILQDGKPSYVTIPIKKDSDFLDINQRSLSDNWDEHKEKVLRKLSNNYRKAPYFNKVYGEIESILNHNNKNLFEFINNALTHILKMLEVPTELIKSSSIDYNNNIPAQDKVLDICNSVNATEYINAIGGLDLYDKRIFFENGVNLKFLKTQPILYQQFNNEFIPWLSIIDVLMFNSITEIKQFLDKYTLM